MALPFRLLKGHNIEDTLYVDCATVYDVTRTRTIFEFTCPTDMKITTINKCLNNGEHPCGWEVIYVFHPEDSKNCDAANAKEGFENILKLIPSNVTASEKEIIGIPGRYRVKYNVDTCICEKLDVELPYVMEKLMSI